MVQIAIAGSVRGPNKKPFDWKKVPIGHGRERERHTHTHFGFPKKHAFPIFLIRGGRNIAPRISLLPPGLDRHTLEAGWEEGGDPVNCLDEKCCIRFFGGIGGGGGRFQEKRTVHYSVLSEMKSLERKDFVSQRMENNGNLVLCREIALLLFSLLFSCGREGGKEKNAYSLTHVFSHKKAVLYPNRSKKSRPPIVGN